MQVELSIISQMFVRSAGVHIIHERAENAEDHPHVTQVDFDFPVVESDERRDLSDEEIENSVGLFEEDEVDE